MQTVSDDELQQLTLDMSYLLRQKRWQLSSSESCTGGWLAKCCTDLEGSSAWFERGFVSYSNQSKHDLLAVKQATLDQFGAVSEATVIEMVQGALNHSQADISVAITGIAGPTGGTVDKPVGTVWFAWTSQYAKVHTRCHHLSGDRDQVRRQAVAIAVIGIAEYIEATK
ncbi:MAG: damage-inducible protein CinA [Gammaproteobacteria bacterium]|nr:MAG: damage-inducible protein CinA [Gammaproteobacteria bacterium]